MKFHSILRFSLIAVLLLSCGGKATVFPDQHKKSKLDQSKRQFPKADHYVNDFADDLTTQQETELDKICADYETKTTNQLVVATVKDLGKHNDIISYSQDMFNEWEIGTRRNNNGILIVLCMDCQEIRIATGYGAEKKVTNEMCDQIIDPGMVDHFEDKDPYGGLKYGIEEIIKRWGN